MAEPARVPGPPGEETSTPLPANRVLRALDQRLGIDALRYPVPAHSRGLAYSLGGITLGAFALLILSGLYLSQFYQPGEETARQSVLGIINSVTWGEFVRGFHYWGAMAAVVFATMHALRVFVTGAYKKPREFMWLLGVGLLGITLFFVLSGTILKWDQEAMEALDHVGEVSALLGPLGFFLREDWGGPFLDRMFAMHVVILPVTFLVLATWHLLLIRHHKMAPTPFYGGPEPEPSEPFIRHLWRLALYTLILGGVLAALAIVATPELGAAPVEGIEVTKPPFLLLWMYGAENVAGGVSGILWAALILAGAMIIVPFVDRGPERGLRSAYTRVVIGAVVVAVLVGLTLYAYFGPAEEHLEMGVVAGWVGGVGRLMP